MSGCVLFDFDGVIADTEHLHLQAYNQAFRQHAAALGRPLEIARDDYFGKYIVYGDREAILHMLSDAGLPHDDALLTALGQTKSHLFRDRLGDFAEPLPGVRALLSWLESRRVPRAICSGAARHEIDMLLAAFRLRGHFEEIIAIEDVRRGKPDPEGYLLTFDRLNIRHDAALDKAHTLVIEDSIGGCSAARAAGLRVLGVATGLPLERLRQCADHAVADLTRIDHQQLAQWLGLPTG
jgi:beta-phosphoglucomutase